MNPSLLLIPDRYKASKLYSQIPDTGAGDLAFTRALDTATRVNSAGLIEAVGIDIPRIDYTGGGCGKLLLEPQRQNLVTFSESFNNAAWTKSASATTITANTSTSPSGFQDADTWTINAAGARFVAQTKTMTAGAVTASFFVKSGTSNFFYLRIEDGATNAGFTFNVANGTLGQSNSITLVPIPSIEDYGNGWYRCSVTTTVVGTSIAIQGFVATSASVISGVLNGSLICWGAQLEAGSYATSYIPTLGAAVTRSADAASKTGISALIGATEGTIFLEVAVNNANTANGVFFECIGASTADTFVFFMDSSNNDLRLFVSSSLVPPVFVFHGYTPSTSIKIALAYKANDFALYVNGVSKSVAGVDVVPSALANIYLNSNRSGAEIMQSTYKTTALYTSRLSNADLQTLTTL